jgi:eukaryotic-like serine/threonine-protein kinase
VRVDQLLHYRIIRKLGAGGMGDIYLAQDQRLNRYVALKFLAPRFTRDPERLRRFEQEAQFASAVNHPNVLTIHGIEREGGSLFIVTEYVDGESLRRRLMRGKLALREALEIAAGAADGLAAAHEYWIVHRDVKPDNIMIRSDGVVKVLDFGLAKLNGGGLLEADPAQLRTAPGAIAGTLHYVAPERLAGEAADPRSDVFSLGAVLHEMLTGEPPFDGGSVPEVIDAILHREPAPLERIADAPAALPAIVGRALARDPEERFQSAKDLSKELRSALRELDLIEYRRERAGEGERS